MCDSADPQGEFLVNLVLGSFFSTRLNSVVHKVSISYDPSEDDRGQTPTEAICYLI